MGPSQTAGKKYCGKARGAMVKIRPETTNKAEGLEEDSEDSISASDAGLPEARSISNCTTSDVIKIPGTTVENATAYPGQRNQICEGTVL